jgi:dTDP-4-dehydrorhamnose 3,5-epimerase
MKVRDTPLPGVFVIEPAVFGDDRGWFVETFQAERYHAAGLKSHFVQDNLSWSRRHVLRGMHFQEPQAQAKLVFVLSGTVFDVVVDIRRGSPSFGRWTGEWLSGENRLQLSLPVGFAHGFCVVSEGALFAYKSSAFYAPQAEMTLAWNDPDVGIRWPVDAPVLSAKDAAGARLRDIPTDRLPAFSPA